MIQRSSVEHVRTSRLGLVALDLLDDLPQTIDIAARVEEMGYGRYWITDHIPQPSPELIVALLAGLTSEMRIGTAGVLLRFRNPLQVAENFFLLEGLFENRIDAGICAGGALPEFSNWFQEAAVSATYEQRTAEFIGYLRGDLRRGDARFERFRTGAPEIWSFGTGLRSAKLAAQHGIAFGCSICHSYSKDDLGPMLHYRKHFKVKGTLTKPLASVAVAGVLADTEARAEVLRRAHTNPSILPMLVGTVEQCSQQLAEIYKRYAMDEIIFLDVCRRTEDKLRSLELFRDACNTLRL